MTYHRTLRGKGQLASVLDDIPGVGQKRREALLKHFGSVGRLRTATLVELQAVPGLPETVARRLYEQLRPPGPAAS